MIMDPVSDAASGSKIPGIPRLSKLPHFKPAPTNTTTNATTPSKLRPAASVEALRKTPSQPSLVKKSSLSSLSRPAYNTSAIRPPGFRASYAGPTSLTRPAPVTANQDRTVKKPTGRPQSRQLSSQGSHRTVSSSVDGAPQEEDTLGDLDGFGRSSRQGFRDSGYDGGERDLPGQEPETTIKLRKSRPSLSDRTIESLSQISANGPRRRKSSFFTSETPTNASSSRPGTSDGVVRNVSNAPSTPMAQRQTALPLRGSTTSQVGKRTLGGGFTGNKPVAGKPLSSMDATPSKLARPPTTSTPSIRRPAFSGIKTPAAKPPQSRLTPKAPAVKAPTTPTPIRSANPIAKKGAVTTAATPSASKTPGKPSSSSAALREQIAKAKAAKKATPSKAPSAAVSNDFNFDFDLPADPFTPASGSSGGALRKRVDAARCDGRLNIAAMGLNKIPEAVLQIYDFNANNDSSISWGEVVDLVRFNAADNDIEQIADDVFPDIDLERDDLDEDSPGPQFGGVEVLDFHGNLLRDIPIGFRRLQRLTTLNLSRNRLTFAVFDVIAEITQLKDLKLADNALEGPLPESIGALTNLTNLELQGNMLSALPDSLRELVNLHVLNVGDNQLKTLPMASLCDVPLTELIASKNMLEGTIFDAETFGHPTLQVLNVASNSLSSLGDGGPIQFPTLQTLNISSNRVQILSDMSPWTELTSLLASENKLTDFPTGFTSLQKLRIADFTSNDISKLDPMVSLMEGLETLVLTANPLRERKYLTMQTDQLKTELRQRVDTLATEHTATTAEGDLSMVAEDGEISIEDHPWTLQPAGTLNLSLKDISELDSRLFTPFAHAHNINRLYLQSNKFQSIPPIISLSARTLTTLNLSHNKIDLPLSENLELPCLRELCLAHNKISTDTLSLLVAHLDAPQLSHLDLTYNRLGGSLPILRASFPSLLVLSAAENSIEAVSREALEGLKNVDLRNNSIERLEPKIGLLVGTLTGFEVEGNRFRVPSYHVLKMGTEKVLGWLRDKIPEGEREGFEELF